MKIVILLVAMLCTTSVAHAGALWNGIFVNQLGVPIQVFHGDEDCWHPDQFYANPVIQSGGVAAISSNVDFSGFCFFNQNYWMKFTIVAEDNIIVRGQLLTIDCSPCNCTVAVTPSPFSMPTHQCGAGPVASTKSYTVYVKTDPQGHPEAIAVWGLYPP